MTRSDALLARIVEANNRRVRDADPGRPNPRADDDQPWQRSLAARVGAISEEWHRFADAEGRLPRIEDVLAESQGNSGTWRFGLLVAQGRPLEHAERHFPATVAALGDIPRLRSAMWSVLEPGTELPEHHGPNAGVLRYHLGIDCGADTALRVGDEVRPYRNGVGILFDDTAPHAAWNRGVAPRVTLFCEVERPLPLAARWPNRAVQGVIGLDRRYRTASRRAAEWHHALNPRQRV